MTGSGWLRGRGAALAADPALSVAVVALWLLLALFVIFPLAMLFARIGQGEGGFNLAGVGTMLTDRHQIRAFWNSLLLGTLVGVAGTVLGFLFAFTVSRARLPPTVVAVLDAAILLPLVSPPFTTAIAMIFSFGPRGLITYDLLGIKGFTIYGLGSTLFSETLTFFPIAYLTLKPMLAAIDSNVESMAASLGASRWRVFRTVTLPLTIPGLANAFLLLFAASLADFATPLILAGNSFPVLPTQAYLQITGLFDLRGGAVLSLVLLVPGARGVPAAALLGEPPLLRDDHRQGRGPDAVRQHRAVGALAAGRRLLCRGAGRRLFLRAAALRLARRGAGRQPRLHAATLPHDLYRRPEGNPRHVDHRRPGDAARRPLRDPARLPGREESNSRGGAAWNSCR